jgi:hypothetical protein
MVAELVEESFTEAKQHAVAGSPSSTALSPSLLQATRAEPQHGPKGSQWRQHALLTVGALAVRGEGRE